MSEWQPFSTAPEDTDGIDLFGWIDYDCIEMRLTDCEKVGGEWHYFCCGILEPISKIGFHPTHWMPLPADPTE